MNVQATRKLKKKAAAAAADKVSSPRGLGGGTPIWPNPSKPIGLYLNREAWFVNVASVRGLVEQGNGLGPAYPSKDHRYRKDLEGMNKGLNKSRPTGPSNKLYT